MAYELECIAQMLDLRYLYMYIMGTHSHSLSTGYWTDEGRAWQLYFEVNLLSTSSLL